MGIIADRNVFCAKCGASAGHESAFCVRCGATLTGILNVETTKRPVAVNSVAWIFVGLLLLNVTAGAMIALSYKAPILLGVSQYAAGFFIAEGVLAVIGVLLSPVIIPILFAVGIIGAGVQLGISSSRRR